MKVEAGKATDTLRAWDRRFTEADHDSHRPGDAMRILSTNTDVIKKLLAWLQRDYLYQRFSYYDPTSGRDEDLPLDLDHIVPASRFSFRWNASYLPNMSGTSLEAFRWPRGVVGNSLGNFRWLCASDNRARGAGIAEFIPKWDVFEDNPASWNDLIKAPGEIWSPADVEQFQKLIDIRTVYLTQRLIEDSGMRAILPRHDRAAT